MGFFDRLFGTGKSGSKEIPVPNFDAPLDGDEKRTWQILANLPRDEAYKQHPDFDVAYLRAAYPTGNSGHHQSANVFLLEQAATHCIRKSWILGRLAAYWTWRENAVNALTYATKSLLAAQSIPPDSPGDLVGSLNLLHAIFTATGNRTVAQKLAALNPGYDESPEMQQKIAKIARKLAAPKYKSTVSAAASRLQAKKFS